MLGEENSSAHAPAPASEESSRTDATSVTGAHDGYDAQQILALARHPPPGASVYSPTAVPSAALNPRSCVTCRRRKVRCDKHMPCSNCRRAQIPCIFPAPGRAPRRPRPKDPNAPTKQPSSERELELMKRLRKLEGIVEELSGQIEVETVRHTSSAGNSPETVAGHHGRDDLALRPRLSTGFHAVNPAGGGHSQESLSAASGSVGARPPARQASGTLSEPDTPHTSSPDMHRRFGRLVLNEKGVTRYVSSAIWSSITDELDELRKASQDLTDEDSDESDLDATPESAEHDKSLLDHHSFIFGYRSADVDLRPLHPLPSQIPFIWQVYQENVDPVLKVVHIPSMSKVIKGLRHNMDSLTPPMEALMFAIYYASITSLEEDEVRRNFNAEKSILIQKYRFALEQALAKAEFLTKPDLTVIQAFLLFLVLVRRHDDTRFAWTLTALVIRMSQALGLHRDGSHFPTLTPFEVEMRRRLFWAVCVLDLRSAEDQGTELTIVNRTFDTQLPLNINDSDISPESERLPESREGVTDMAFSLLRYEICALARRLHTASSDMAVTCPPDSAKSLEEREALLTDLHRRVEERLLKDSSSPMSWVTSIFCRVIVAKMRLVIYQPVLFPGPGNEYLSEDARARIFNASLDIFEYSHILNTDPRCKQWCWLFQTWNHWHALAYTLIEASHRPWGPKSERAWAALNLTFPGPKPAELEKLAGHHGVWMPLRKLYLKVKKHREAEIARLRADPEAARELDVEDRAGASPTSFGSIPSSVKRAIALERWRKLVHAPPPLPEPTPVPEQPEQRSQQPCQSATKPSQASESTSIEPAVGPVFAKPELMDFIDTAMASPTFVSYDFAPLMFPPDGPPDLSRFPFLGYPAGPGGLSRGDSGVGFNPGTNTNTPVPAQAMGPPLHQQQQTQPTAVGQTPHTTGTTDESLPPWLWPANAASPGFNGVPNLNTEDVDVNMDETFDWQTWQESLGRYELEANGGRAGSTWGAGL